MLYFNTLPKILTPDQNGNYIAMTNLMARAKLLDELQDNPMLFYKYSIQESDTPEIVADKYYGDSYRYWVVLYANQILDPVWQWPLPYNQFLLYLDEKYAEAANTANLSPYDYTKQTVYEYQKIIKTTDNSTSNTTTKVVAISSQEYANVSTGTSTYIIPNSGTCTITTDKTIKYIYDYEYDLNESRREIKLLDSFYVGQMEEQFSVLMNK